MKGLLYRDLWMSRFIIAFLLVMQLVFTGIAMIPVFGDDAELAVMFHVIWTLASFMLASCLNTVSFEYDENNTFPQFALSSPACSSGYLKSKFAVTFIIYGITLMTNVIITVIYMIDFGAACIAGILVSIPALCSSLICFAVQLPFTVKFGKQSGMNIFVGFVMLMAGIIGIYFLFGDLHILEKPLVLPSLVFLICIPGLTLALTAGLLYGSYRLSLHFIKTDEDIYR